MIKYLFSDLDGTLYINDDVYRKDFKAIWQFVEAGGTFAIATGRTDLEILNFVKEERFPEVRFRVSANGAMVIADDELLVQHPFSHKAQTFLKNYFEKHIGELNTIEVSTAERIYFINDPENWILNYKNASYEVNARVLERFLDSDFAILKLFVEGTENFIKELVRSIESDYRSELVVFNDVTALNIAAQNNNKGTGIQAIMKKYHILPEEIAVIGDAANDLDMFKITPNSFTFHHAKDFIQQEATYVVESVATAVGIIMDFNRQEQKK